MLTRFQYTDQADRQRLIYDHPGMLLISEENLFDGNFLTFTDIEPAATMDEQMAEVKENTIILMDVLGTMFEAMLEKGTV